MAIITIPSSISGVTVPGNLLNGPLSSLFGNSFAADSLQYPRDLGSATKGHWIHFTVKEVQPVGYDEAVTAITNLNAAVDAAKSLLTPTGLNFRRQTTKTVGNIYLYTPDTMNFQYDANYNDVSATGVVTKLAGDVGAKLVGKEMAEGISSVLAAGKDAANLIGQKAGYAVNPQLQLLFQSIGFRTYQMSFTFTPYSKQEAQQVKKIIEMFRKNAAPRIVTGAAGAFFTVPSVFQVQFFLNGQENTQINKVKDSVITNIDVNYSPNGWSAHEDGAPVQTTLTIQFKEAELVDRDQIAAGY